MKPCKCCELCGSDTRHGHIYSTFKDHEANCLKLPSEWINERYDYWAKEAPNDTVFGWEHQALLDFLDKFCPKVPKE